ncbi:MAG: hypothetical protein GX973_07490, partial [Firmicutes bacterium]|nr:hypothetical protein [Bacillota bacterium]
MKRRAAFLLLGLIAGGAAFNLVTGPGQEELHREKERLKVELFETADRLRQLEKQLQTHEAGQVRAVNIELSSPFDTLVELALRQALAEITSELIGEKSEQLKPSLLVKLLDQRVIDVEGKQYLVTVCWVVIGEELTFNLTAS